LDEQQSRILEFIKNGNHELINIFIEQKSGKNNSRAELDKAIDICLKKCYTLLFTKLDRLSREVKFLFTLRNKGVKLHCIELPELNTLTLGIFGTVAQYERELISIRTKRALAELKTQNVKLGSPQNLSKEARKKGVESNKRNRTNNENWKI